MGFVPAGSVFPTDCRTARETGNVLYHGALSCQYRRLSSSNAQPNGMSPCSNAETIRNPLPRNRTMYYTVPGHQRRDGQSDHPVHKSSVATYRVFNEPVCSGVCRCAIGRGRDGCGAGNGCNRCSSGRCGGIWRVEGGVLNVGGRLLCVQGSARRRSAVGIPGSMWCDGCGRLSFVFLGDLRLTKKRKAVLVVL